VHPALTRSTRHASTAKTNGGVLTIERHAPAEHLVALLQHDGGQRRGVARQTERALHPTDRLDLTPHWAAAAAAVETLSADASAKATICLAEIRSFVVYSTKQEDSSMARLARAVAPTRATWDRRRGQLAHLLGATATAVELCLFEHTPDDEKPSAGSRCPSATGPGLHAYPARRATGCALRLPGERALRAEQGHRFNPVQTAIDPTRRQ